jgi:hypothetical protein
LAGTVSGGVTVNDTLMHIAHETRLWRVKRRTKNAQH